MIEWKSIKVNVPEKEGLYLTYNPKIKGDRIKYTIDYYSKKWNMFMSEEGVSHWADLNPPSQQDFKRAKGK